MDRTRPASNTGSLPAVVVVGAGVGALVVVSGAATERHNVGVTPVNLSQSFWHRLSATKQVMAVAECKQVVQERSNMLAEVVVLLEPQKEKF